MKNLVLAALLSFAFGTPAVAATSFELQEIRSFANGEDISDLTDIEVTQLLAIIHSDDRDSRKYQHVRNFFVHRSGESFLANLFK